jgi:hypothetical protein
MIATSPKQVVVIRLYPLIGGSQFPSIFHWNSEENQTNLLTQATLFTPSIVVYHLKLYVAIMFLLMISFLT